MWSSSSTVNLDPEWGTYINSLDDEAQAIEEGKPFAALLDGVGLIKAEGEDAETFLQGQTTCDFTSVNKNLPKLGAHLNVKGRAQSTFIAFKLNDCFYLLMGADQVEPTLAALNKYAVFSKVALTQCSDLLVVGLGGQNIQDTIQALFGSSPESGCLNTISAGAVMQIPHLGYLAVITAENMQSTVDSIKQQPITLCGDNAWNLHRINSGFPQISAATSEQWIPQEINYELIEGVSFDKGCYKGQEIVARIHYRGKPKVRTAIASIESSAPLTEVKPGDKITGQEQSGSLLEVARVSERTLKALTTLKVSVSESENLKLEQNDDSQIRVLPLPYAIT